MTTQIKYAFLVVIIFMAVFGAVSLLENRLDLSPKSPTPIHSSNILTFNKNIAPIIFTHCSPCHRKGEAAPFSLLTYKNVRNRAEQIKTVIETRYMPPWLPTTGLLKFSNERVLTEHEIQSIKQWISEGSIEGDPSDLPNTPSWPKGWQLGKPDLIVKMTTPYHLHQDIREDFRNFVIPINISSTHYVRAIEFRPDNRKIVHHAELLIDRTGIARKMDQQDSRPGFSGMIAGSTAKHPSGHLLGWTPGKHPYEVAKGMAWQLEPGTDFVLELHLQSTGKPETILASIGLFFTENPPTKHPFMIRLTSGNIDIPPGESNYLVEDSYVLPIDVQLLSIYPHAHYICRNMKGHATFPDQTKHLLVHIEEWDFNWQDQYQYANPIWLPKGTVLSMNYTYDNSSNNTHNPRHPPGWIRGGGRTIDEMGDLWIQVLPRNQKEYVILHNDYLHKDLDDAIEAEMHFLNYIFDDVQWYNNMGKELVQRGSFAEAENYFRSAIELQSHFSNSKDSLYFLKKKRRQATQVKILKEFPPLITPNFSGVHKNLGDLLKSMGKDNDAENHY